MSQVVINKTIPFSVKAQFGIPLLATCFVLTFVEAWFVILLVISVVFMFTNYAYEFNSSLKHKVRIQVLTITIFTYNKVFEKPDYISLFNQPLSTKMVSGFMEFGNARYKEYAIKFFKGDSNETIYRSGNKEKVLGLGLNLSKVLDVELFNNLK